MNGFRPKYKSPPSFKEFQEDREEERALLRMEEFDIASKDLGYDGDDEYSSDDDEYPSDQDFIKSDGEYSYDQDLTTTSDDESEPKPQNPSTILAFLKELKPLPTKSTSQRS